MKKIVLLCTGMFLCMTTFGQSISVQNTSTLQGIEGVMIEANATKFTTNNQGKVELTNIKPNTNLTISHPWYQERVMTLEQVLSDKGSIFLTEKITTYDEVVVSASKFEEKAKDVAQPIHVIRSTDLENMNQSSMADVIANTGKVMVQKSQLGGGSPVIRGFETNKVLMVVDGVRMNNAIYRGGHVQNIITLDNAVMDKVEIVFGPGSVVYGSDALGGVMHFYTKNPLLSTTDKMMVKASAYTRYMSACSGFAANATISAGGKKFGSLTSFTYSNYGDLRQGSVRNPFYSTFGNRTFYAERINGMDSMVVNKDTNLQIGSGYKQYDILQKFLFKQSDKVSHTLNFQYSTSSDINRYDRLVQITGNGKPKFAQWYYGPQERLMASYTLSLSNKNRMYDHGRVILAYQKIEESRQDRKFGSNTLNSRVESLNIMSANLDFEKALDKNELRYGAEFYTNDVQSNAHFTDIVTGIEDTIDTRYPDGGSKVTGISAYLTHTMEIHPKLILNDGIRFSSVNLSSTFVDQQFFPFPFSSINQKNMALNGNIGLIFMPVKSWRITGLFSTGFRAPNVDDLSKVFLSTAGNLVVPNPNIKPEYTYNAEFGISKTFNERVNLGVTAYYTWYKNVITTLPSMFNGEDSIVYKGTMSKVVSSQNAGEAYLYGIEASLNAAVTSNFSITSNLTYTYARIKTDTTDYPLDHIPPVFGKTSFNLKVKKFRGEFFVMYSGWKRMEDYNIVGGEDNEAYATAFGMPSWYTLNLRTTYQFAKAVSLQLACENILDHNYRGFSSNISAPGRNFIITLRGNF